MTRPAMRDALLADERAEFDMLLQQLDQTQKALVRIIEIFMAHELSQAAMLNAEIRAGHEQIGRRLAALEAAANPAVVAGLHQELIAQTEAIGQIGHTLAQLAAQLRGLPERVAALERDAGGRRAAALA